MPSFDALPVVAVPPSGARPLSVVMKEWGVSRNAIRLWIEQGLVDAVWFHAGGVRLVYVTTRQPPMPQYRKPRRGMKFRKDD